MIFVIVGMPASGKNIARDYAASRGIPYFATGDIVRTEVKKRGLEPNPENTASVSDELRGDDGMGVTRRALAEALGSNAPVVFMEGMRSWPEIMLVRSETECVVVSFLAPRWLRRQRVISRGREDDSLDAFDERDSREITYGAAVPIALADEYILNASAMAEATQALDEIVRKYVK